MKSEKDKASKIGNKGKKKRSDEERYNAEKICVGKRKWV